MKVTTKGQVTIPQEIRDRMNIQPGAEVEFRVEGNAVRIVPVRAGGARGKRIVERLRGRASVRMTTEEIMKLTRGRG